MRQRAPRASDSPPGLSRFVASHPCIRVRRVHELFRPFLAIFRAFLAILRQFESEHAASRVDVDPVPVGKQTSTLRADTPVDHVDRKSTRLNSSHSQISYAVFCLKKKKKKTRKH